jgi:hypothetical protein
MFSLFPMANLTSEYPCSLIGCHPNVFPTSQHLNINFSCLAAPFGLHDIHWSIEFVKMRTSGIAFLPLPAVHSLAIIEEGKRIHQNLVKGVHTIIS